MPNKSPKQQGSPLTFRIPDSFRGKLLAAAEANERSLSHEIRARLERSFDLDLALVLEGMIGGASRFSEKR